MEHSEADRSCTAVPELLLVQGCTQAAVTPPAPVLSKYPKAVFAEGVEMSEDANSGTYGCA